MPVSAETRLGPYELLDLVGAGGMGVVYRARDTRLGREVAVKCLPADVSLNAERLHRFEQEARLAGSLNHPNVLSVYDVGTHDGAPYIVTELLEGRSLRELLASGPLTTRKAVEYAGQIARGLAAAHERAVVHRDLKPANVFVTRDGRVKILDFGLAKLTQPDPECEPDSHASTASEGHVAGTVGYMAPEQLRGLPVDPRCDIFAFGAVLYEMLSGRRAFPGETTADRITAILTKDPEELSRLGLEVPPALESIVRRCLEKEAGERFESAKDVAFALETIRSGTASGGSAGATPPASPPKRRRVWPLASALLAAAVATFAGLRLWLAPGAGSLPQWIPRQLTSDPGWEAEPAVSPDGSAVAYSSNRAGSADLWVVDSRSGPPLRLTDDPAADRSPRWFPDGTALAFVSDRVGARAIWKVPRLGGSATLLVPDAEDPAVSPDGTKIAFARRGPSGDYRILVAALSDTLHPSPATGDGDGRWDHRHPSWSPDGREIAYADSRDVWVVPAVGGPARRLTSDQTVDDHPVWSADGRSVYFSSWREGTRALWRAPATGGSARRVSFGTGPESEASVSAQGTALAFSTHDTRTAIVLFNRRSRERDEIPGLKETSTPAFSPDGTRLVFSSDRDGATDLWIQPIEAGRPRGEAVRLTDEPGSEFVPRFSPDGRFVAFDRALDSRRRVFVARASGGRPVPFVEEDVASMLPAWSPDGTRIAYVSDRDGEDHLWVRPVKDGAPAGEPRQLTSGRGYDYLPAWSPDGRSIAFLRNEAGAREVWTVAPEGGSPARSLTRGADARFARWDIATGSLLVSGTWGTRTVSLRRLSAAAAPEPLAIELGDADSLGDFDVSPDGETLAFVRYEQRGDVWLFAAKPGAF